MGGTMGGVMGTGMRMMSAGLSMGQVQSVTRAVIAYAREKAGEDAVGEIVAAIPGSGAVCLSTNVVAATIFASEGEISMAYPITEIQGIGTDVAAILKSDGIRTTVGLLRIGQDTKAAAEDRSEDRR